MLQINSANIRKYLCFLGLFIGPFSAVNAQGLYDSTPQQIECQLKVSIAGHELDTIAGNHFGDTLIHVERLQFYLHASHGGKSNEKNAILLGMSQPTKHLLANAPFDLYLGVDSVLNYNGVHEGALDPINGMYWTWQTGYIHCKLEGKIICD